MGFSAWMPGQNQPPREQSLEVIDAAIASGVNFFNTAEFYGIEGHNELILGIIKGGGWEGREGREMEREKERGIALVCAMRLPYSPPLLPFPLPSPSSYLLIFHSRRGD